MTSMGLNRRVPESPCPRVAATQPKICAIKGRGILTTLDYIGSASKSPLKNSSMVGLVT
jgi:hypothetical protein